MVGLGLRLRLRLLCCCAAGAAHAQQPTLTFGLSPVGFPADMSNLLKWFETVAKIPGGGVYGPTLWRDSLALAGQVPQIAQVVATESAKLKMPPVVVLGWHADTNPPTPVLASPHNPVNNWTNGETRTLFQQAAVAYATKFQPELLFLGSETDWYAVSNPADYRNWVAVYVATRKAIRAVSPKTKVGTCFQFERISGTGKLTGFNTPAWQALTQHDLTTLDVVGVTSYPMFATKDASGVDEKYLEPLTHKLPAGMPVAILESGWPAECGLKAGCPWNAGALQQLELAKAAKKLAQKSAAEGHPLLTYNWLFINAENISLPSAVAGMGDFATISLRSAEGKPRPLLFEAWTTGWDNSRSSTPATAASSSTSTSDNHRRQLGTCPSALVALFNLFCGAARRSTVGDCLVCLSQQTSFADPLDDCGPTFDSWCQGGTVVPPPPPPCDCGYYAAGTGCSKSGGGCGCAGTNYCNVGGHCQSTPGGCGGSGH